MELLGQCRALTNQGNKCPSQAHETLVLGVKELVFCSHHFGVVKALLTAFRPRIEVAEEKRN